MALLYWDLPGPRLLADQAVGGTLAGRTCLVRLPAHVPAGFDVVLRRALQSEEAPYTLLRPASDIVPAVAVAQALTGQAVSGVPSAAAILRMPDACGQTALVLGMTPDLWPAWRVFLSEWQAAIAFTTTAARPRILAVLAGDGFAHDLSASTGTTILRLKAARETDLATWAEDHLTAANHTLPRLQRRLLRTTLVELAQWDAGTIADLARETPETILEPHGWLRRHAAARGWTSETPATDACSTAGMMEGDRSIHLALQLLRAPEEATAELERRLWHAQVPVLLPWVEDRRVEFLSQFEREFEMLRPRTLPLNEIEIGSMGYFLERTNLPREATERVFFTRYVRNHLAHRTRLSANEVLNLPLWA